MVAVSLASASSTTGGIVDSFIISELRDLYTKPKHCRNDHKPTQLFWESLDDEIRLPEVTRKFNKTLNAIFTRLFLIFSKNIVSTVHVRLIIKFIFPRFIELIPSDAGDRKYQNLYHPLQYQMAFGAPMPCRAGSSTPWNGKNTPELGNPEVVTPIQGGHLLQDKSESFAKPTRTGNF